MINIFRSQRSLTIIVVFLLVFPTILCSQENDLFQKVRDNDIAGMKAMIKAGADVNQVEEFNGFTALMTACVYNLPEATKSLIEAGANINHKEIHGYTSLLLASQYNHSEVAKILILAGADINITGDDGASALLAAASSSREITELLLSHGAEISLRTNDAGVITQSLMGVLMDRVSTDLIEILLKAGGDVDEVCKEDYAYGWTPLFMAATNNRPDLVKFLIANGANVNAKARDGKTALSLAEKEGYSEVIEILKANGAK